MSVLHSNCNYLDIDADVSKGSIPVKNKPHVQAFFYTCTYYNNIAIIYYMGL